MSAGSSGRWPRPGPSPRSIRRERPRCFVRRLAMWRGHAYEEFVYESWAQAEIARLEELASGGDRGPDRRRSATRGWPASWCPSCRASPGSTRCGSGSSLSLMLALYRCGRGAEALRACASFRGDWSTRWGSSRRRACATSSSGSRRRRRPARRRGRRRRRSVRSGLTVRGYELREESGAAPSGRCSAPTSRSIGREVAIKVIRPELADDPTFIRRFEAEAQLVAGLEHPHIIPLYDYWREPGAAYLVMRLIESGSSPTRRPRRAAG